MFPDSFYTGFAILVLTKTFVIGAQCLQAIDIILSAPLRCDTVCRVVLLSGDPSTISESLFGRTFDLVLYAMSPAAKYRSVGLPPECQVYEHSLYGRTPATRPKAYYSNIG